ncbi:TonB C-terminal domain-containing protein [Candidatus Thioglobus sp.]|nr:TonB C-terminal domain-containing protein [Candidatus Thioglobus sp.]
MNFFKKITQFFSNLIPKKAEVDSEEKDKGKSSDVQEAKTSGFKNFIIKASSVLYKYLKKFVLFMLGLINTMMQPMVRISKKHPIAFWAAVILHASLLFGLLYANVERWSPPEQNSSILPSAPVQAVMIDMEIIEAEQERLKDLEKQKQQKIKSEEKRSVTAQKDQKVAEQEALKAKAKKIMAELQRKSEEAKTKEAEIQASKANEIIADAEIKTKIEEAKANEIIADAKTKTKIEQDKAKKAEVKRIAEEAKTKEAEILVEAAAKKIELAEAKRKQEEVKTKLAEIKRKAEEVKTQEAEILAKEATALVKEAEAKTKAEELKAKEAVLLAQETARDAEILAKEVDKQVKKAEAKRIAEELKLKLAEAKRVALEIKIKAAEVKQSTIEAKTKDAELLVKEASKRLEEDQQNKDLLELEIAALKEAEAEIQYRQLLAKEVQDEQDTARSLIIEDQLNTLQNAYINNIAARVKTFWRYQSAEDDWTAEVYVVQDRDGNVKAVDVKNANVGNSSLGKSFKDSIERAVNKASPLPGAPDEAVFDKELYFIFSVN